MEPDRKSAGLILERWDELVAGESAALLAITDFDQLCTMVIRSDPDPEIESFLKEKGNQG